MTNATMSLIESATKTIPLVPVATDHFSAWLAKQPAAVCRWLEIHKFKAEPFTFCPIADINGNLKQVIVGIAVDADLYCLAHLPMALPEGAYHLEDPQGLLTSISVELGWGLGAYQFNHYKQAKREPASLLWRTTTDKQALGDLLASIYWVRDLINTPADDMNPLALANEAKKLVKEFAAELKVIEGEALLTENYPTIYAVGRASDCPPRLIDLRWGKLDDKKLTLVGKGVCFDSGGLNLKSTEHMADMKSDMGGAAHVLALARLIMAAKLPVRLRVLIPAVENSISGNAYHPGDIIKTRQGMTVEIGNTDAEGRLILCDALAEAVTEKPQLVLDFATLTGAARVALGTEIAAFFTHEVELATNLQTCADLNHDPIWRLPLYKEYRQLLNSDLADINNVTHGRYGGAITAALFLQEFVPKDIPWVHFDIMAANVAERPGRPKGGEAMGLRACFDYIKHYFK